MKLGLRHLALALLPALGLLGCGSGHGSGTSGGTMVVFRQEPGPLANPDPKGMSYLVQFLTPRAPACSATCCYASGEVDNPGDGDSVLRDAGDVTIADVTAGASGALGVLTFLTQPGAPSQYGILDNTDNLSPEPVWTAGDELSASAPGGSGMGAFSGTIRSVALFTGLTPALGFGNPGVVVPRTQDFQVAWAPDPAHLPGESVEVTLTGGGGAVVVCTADDAQGQLTFPASLLGELAPGTGSVTFYRIATAQTANADVTLISRTESIGDASVQ